MDVMCWLHKCPLIAHSYKNNTHNEKLYSSNLAIDFIECHHDSANFKQVWFALTALAILQIFVCAKKGSSSTK